MNLALVRKIADAVLYEGYILYPYRASAIKNQQRFNFGVVMPQQYSQRQQGSEACTMHLECLVEGDAPRIDVHLRFLQVISREVYDASRHASSGPEDRLVQALEVDGNVYHTWQEAIERQVSVENLLVTSLAEEPYLVEFEFQPLESVESLHAQDGMLAGRIVRRQQLLQGRVEVTARHHRRSLHSVQVQIQNLSPLPSVSHRDEALPYSLASTHSILVVRQGRFISLIDPPESCADLAARCSNVGAWPVLAGSEDERDMMLASPIILYDFPQIAPESDGDYFDGTEIDEMLALRVMTLTDEEKREMAELDARARMILERTESLPQEQLQKLHGAIRSLKPHA
jgi:hypothetical protein